MVHAEEKGSFGRIRAEGDDLVLSPPAAEKGAVGIQASALCLQPAAGDSLLASGSTSLNASVDFRVDPESGDLHITTSDPVKRVHINGRDVLAEVDELRTDLRTAYRLLSSEQRAMAGFDPVNSRVKLLEIPATTGVTSQRFVGGVEAADGRIFCVPRSANNVLVINPHTETLENMFEGQLPDDGHSVSKYGGGVRVRDGRIFFLPAYETAVLIIDPATNTFDNTSISGLPTGNKWFGVALSHDGIVVGFPWQNVGVIFIDPETMEVDRSSITASDLGHGGWQSASTADNGIIYGCPRFSVADSILMVDPKTKVFAEIPIPGHITGGNKFAGGEHNDNHIYCIPYASPDILVLDTLSNKTITIPIVTNPELSFKYTGAAVTPAGHLFMAPFSSTSVAVLDTNVNPSSALNDTHLPVSGVGTTSSKFWGAVYGKHSTGFVYLIPYSADYVQVIRP